MSDIDEEFSNLLLFIDSHLYLPNINDLKIKAESNKVKAIEVTSGLLVTKAVEAKVNVPVFNKSYLLASGIIPIAICATEKSNRQTRNFAISFFGNEKIFLIHLGGII